jgi:glyoxalase/bleomycin resistance protein/dioxygenase superfamily protein
MLKVWGRRNSVNVQKVLWLVGELGIEHEHIPAGGPFMRLGDKYIELMQFLAPRGRPIEPDSRSNDRWFQHIAIVVRDMGAVYARLRDLHVEPVSSAPQRLPDWNPSAAGIEAFYFRDPDEHNLEVLKFPSGKGLPKWHAGSDALFSYACRQHRSPRPGGSRSRMAWCRHSPRPRRSRKSHRNGGRAYPRAGSVSWKEESVVHLLIVGSGFAGTRAAHVLEHLRVGRENVSQRADPARVPSQNYALFAVGHEPQSSRFAAVISCENLGHYPRATRSCARWPTVRNDRVMFVPERRPASVAGPPVAIAAIRKRRSSRRCAALMCHLSVKAPHSSDG